MNTFEEGEIKEAIPNERDNKANWSGGFTWKCNEKFVQKICKAKHSQAFESKIFEIGQIKWFLRLYPNGSGKNNMGHVNLFLYIVSIPSDISKLRVKYSIVCKETETHWNHIKDYKPHAMGSGWSNHRLPKDKLFKFTSFSFKIKLAILEKYDLHNNVIPLMNLSEQKRQKSLINNVKINNINPNHINHNNDMQEIKRTIHSLKSQIQDIKITVNNINRHIDNDNNNKQLIFKMLKEIKSEMCYIKIQTENDNKQQISVQNWLKNIGYSHYYPLFINKGLNNMKYIQQINKQLFDTIQFKQENDKSIIWIAIQSIKNLQFK